MVLGKLPGPGRPTKLHIVGQGPTALAVGAGGVVLTYFPSSVYHFSLLSPSLWEAARYCLKGSLNPKQPTNQSNKVPLHLGSTLSD